MGESTKKLYFKNGWNEAESPLQVTERQICSSSQTASVDCGLFALINTYFELTTPTPADHDCNQVSHAYTQAEVSELRLRLKTLVSAMPYPKGSLNWNALMKKSTQANLRSYRRALSTLVSQDRATLS